MEDSGNTDSIRNSIRALLKGDFSEYAAVANSVPKSKLMVFVSSTFTDTLAERNILHEILLPELQAFAVPRGLEIVLYDMRFGVKDENTKDHLTWVICAAGIRQCYEESDGLFFLSLQGDKYGYTPIPKYLEQEAMEHAKQVNQTKVTKEVLSIAQQWYLLDGNSVPPRFELRNLQSHDDKVFYDTVLPTIRDNLLDSVCFERLANEDELLVFRSVTEWETLLALSLDVERCFWLKRKFELEAFKHWQVEGNKDYWMLRDVMTDPSKELKLSNLQATMESKLTQTGKELIHALPYCLHPRKYLDTINVDVVQRKVDPEVESYLKDWQSEMLKLLLKDVHQIHAKRERWRTIMQTDGIDAEALEEMLHHCKLAYNKASSFLGRTALLGSIVSRLSGEFSPDKNSKLGAVTLALIGKSGAGKTALMSAIALEMSKHRDSPPVIIRFCGTSKESVHGIHLMRSIILQILFLHESKEELLKYVPLVGKLSFDLSLRVFKAMMKKHPVILFLDSLDQLANLKEERSKLSFLRGLEIHPRSKIVVSTLPDEKDESGGWKYSYFCETRLREEAVPCIEVPPLDTNESSGELAHLIESLLQREHRTVTSDQMQVLLSAAIQEPTILYLNLAMEVICQWRSFDKEVVLVPKVKGVIMQIFDGLELAYGPRFTSTALAIITYSRYGVSDSEMQDLLSLSLSDKAMMDEVFQYSQLSKLCFPMHVWLRLKDKLKSMVVEKESHCVRWYHRQLWETADERYRELKLNIHQLLGNYFTNQIPEDVRKSRIIQEQPLLYDSAIPVWFPSTKINQRRVLEGYFHLVKSSQFVDSVREMCSFEFICASAICGDGFNYIAVMSELIAALGSSIVPEKEKTRLEHYYRWLQKEMTTIMANPRLKVFATATSEPHCSIARQEALVYLKTLQGSFPSAFPSNRVRDVWKREFTLHSKGLFDSLLLNLVGHSGEVNSVSWCKNRIVSASDDKTIKIWDAITGELLHNLDGGHAKGVDCVRWDPMGSRFLSSSQDGTLKVWDAVTCQLLRTFQSSDLKRVEMALWFTKSDRLASFSDKTLCVWDLKSDQPVVSIDAHSEQIHAICISPLDDKVVTGGSEETKRSKELISIKIWNLSDTTIVLEKTLHQVHSSNIGGLYWLPNKDRNVLISSSWDGSVAFWDLDMVGDGGSSASPATPIRRFSLDKTTFINGMAWHLPTHQLAIAADDNLVRIWKATEGFLTETSITPNSAEGGDDNFRPFAGHIGPVKCLDWNVDGSRVVSGSEDKTVKVWEAGNQSSQTQSKADNSNKSISHAKFSSDGNWIVTVLESRTLQFWDAVQLVLLKSMDLEKKVMQLEWAANGSSTLFVILDDDVCLAVDVDQATILARHSGPNWKINSAALSLDQTIVVSASTTATIRILDVISGTENEVFETDLHRMHSFQFNHRGDRFLYQGDDFSLEIWDVKGKEVAVRLSGHEDELLNKEGVKWSRDDCKLLSASRDKTLILWESASGRMLQHFKGGHQAAIWGMEWNEEQSLILSADQDNVLVLWNSSEGQPLHVLKGDAVGEAENKLKCFYFVAGGRQVLGGYQSNLLIVWDAANGKVVSRSSGNDWKVANLEVNLPVGSHVVIPGEKETSLELWDLTSGARVARLREKPAKKLADLGDEDDDYDSDDGADVFTILWSPDGSCFACFGLENKHIEIYSAANGSLVQKLICKESPEAARWNPEGNKIAAIDDNKVVVWSVPSGKSLHIFKKEVYELFWSADGNAIFCSDSNEKAFVWDVNTGKLLSTLSINDGLSCFIPQTNLFITGRDQQTMKVREMATGKIVATAKGHTESIEVLAWSLNGLYFSSAGWDKYVIIWDAATGLAVHSPLKGHKDQVTALAWGPDSSLLASGSSDKTIKVWSVPSGELLHNFAAHTDELTCLSWSAKSNLLVSCAWDKLVKVWNVHGEGKSKLSHQYEGHRDSINSAHWSFDGTCIVSAGDDGLVKVWDCLTLH